MNLTASLVLLRPTFCLVKDPLVIPVSKKKRKTGFPFALPLGLPCERVRVSFPRSLRPLTSQSLSRKTYRAKRAYKRGTVSPQDPHPLLLLALLRILLFLLELRVCRVTTRWPFRRCRRRNLLSAARRRRPEELGPEPQEMEPRGRRGPESPWFFRPWARLLGRPPWMLP